MPTHIDVVTSLRSAADVSARRARRWSWIALGGGLLVLTALIAGSALGYSSPWTLWVLAVVLPTNPAVYLLSQRWQTHRAASVYCRLVSVITLATLTATMVGLRPR